MRTTLRRLIVTAVIAVSLPLGLGVATAAYASVDGACSGNTCNGLDPAQSWNFSGAVCSSGAYTVLSEPSLYGGTLELRWGPNCQTNWTRFTPANADNYSIYVYRDSDGVWAGNGLFNFYTFSNSAGTAQYSDQVYSPGPAEACVIDLTPGHGGSQCLRQ